MPQILTRIRRLVMIFRLRVVVRKSETVAVFTLTCVEVGGAISDHWRC